MNKIPVRKIKELSDYGHFSIRKIEKLCMNRDIIQGTHRHDFYFILAVKKGNGQHIIDFTPYDITDYSIFFMRPGQVHQLNLKQGSTGYLIEFHVDFYKPDRLSANQILQKVSNKNYCQLDSDRFTRIFDILTSVFQEHLLKEERFKEVITANLEILFIELIRQSKSPNSISKVRNSYTQERFAELSELLETHITTHKQVAQYADLLHITIYQLNAITREIAGKTCSQLINEHIILEAKRQLLATSNKINQIAYDLGYEDVSYFIRFFRKHTQYTPDSFRLNFK